MKVFKFGGASVKDASAVKNVVDIINRYRDDKLIVVVSAMGKMTNAIEDLHEAYMNDFFDEVKFQSIVDFHLDIAGELFPADHAVFETLKSRLEELENILRGAEVEFLAKDYDRLICYGELLSTTIVEAYFKKSGLDSCWLDARTIIKTNDQYQYAKVNWSETQIESDAYFRQNAAKIVVTQGFIGSDLDGNTTSLGREGSDFSAAIFAYVSDADSVTIWKDVPGMLNADPKHFKDTVKLDAISYREAIELSYYGASVIHPKTVKPLENKKIPLYIRSFQNPDDAGSIIQKSIEYDALVPSFIFKENQCLISISPKDFSFIEEDQLGIIFQAVFDSGIKMNLMQNSALSFTFVFDYNQEKLDELVRSLSDTYHVKYNLGLKLLNIRYYDEKTINELTTAYEVLIRQQTRVNVRMVLKDDK